MKLINTNANNPNSENFEIGKQSIKTTTMYSPIPESLEWHRLTQFKEVGKLAVLNPTLYADWKKRGLIPAWVLKKENERQYQS